MTDCHARWLHAVINTHYPPANNWFKCSVPGNDSEDDSDDELRKAKDHMDSGIDGGLDKNYDQQLSTIAE